MMTDTHRWGADARDVARIFPCDALVPTPDDALFRAVDVGAPAATVFRWLCQLKVAPYSWDWIDNLGRESPRHLIAGLEQLAVGQTFMVTFGLASFERDRHLTLRLERWFWLYGHAALTYVTDDHGDGSSRLVVKVVLRYPRLRAPLYRKIGPALDLVMMRKQLLTIKALAEGSARSA